MTSQSRKGSSKETQCLSNKTIQNLQSQTPYQSDNVLEIPTPCAIPRKCQPGTSPNLALGIQWTIFPEPTLHRSSMNICYLSPALTHLLRLEPPKKLFVLDHAISVDVHATGKWTLVKSTMATVSGALHPFLQLYKQPKTLEDAKLFLCRTLGSCHRHTDHRIIKRKSNKIQGMGGVWPVCGWKQAFQSSKQGKAVTCLTKCASSSSSAAGQALHFKNRWVKLLLALTNS